MKDDIGEYDFDVFSNVYSLPLHEGASKTKEQILLIATIYFAKEGYSSVSMRDIAKVMGMQQSSLYNHFESKEALWREVIEHAKTLYMLYFDHLDSALSSAATFAAVVETILREPKRLVNVFTCYAFSMIQAEQFHDRAAGRIFIETFLTYSIDFIKGWFDRCVERGLVQPFDTKMMATTIMHSTLVGLQVNVHKWLGNPFMEPYEPMEMFADLEKFILWSVDRNGNGAPQQ